MAKRILIVDDEPDICEILRFNLEIEGYEVTAAEAPFDLGADEPLPDLIILDVMMEPMSGFEWARELKKSSRTAAIPIIFCTARTQENDLLTGFALGSDDYICKPFRVSEVKARVKAVLRRAGNSECRIQNAELLAAHGDDPQGNSAFCIQNSALLSYKGITLHMDSKECTVDGRAVPFSRLEFELLALLVGHPGQVFSREQILEKVWPDDTVVLDRTVDVNIRRIRMKIEPYGSCIRTRFGYGYMIER